MSLRQGQGAHAQRLAEQGDVRGRRRHRRGEGRGRGDHRLPQGPQEVPAPRRPHPQGRAPHRPSGHRQDAPRARHRRRGGRSLLQHLRLRLRRDVRRRRREPRARPLRAGQEARALHHLHRRDRRRRSPPRRGPRRRARRARADAQPAPRRDGRLRVERGRHHRRGDQPARRARPGHPAPGPLRPAHHGAPARRARPRGDPPRAREAHTALPRRRPRDPRARHARASRAPTSRTSSTRPPCSPLVRTRTRSSMVDFELAKDKVYMGTERRSMVISDDEKRTTAVHEAGHTLISVLINAPRPRPQGHASSRAARPSASPGTCRRTTGTTSPRSRRRAASPSPWAAASPRRSSSGR